MRFNPPTGSIANQNRPNQVGVCLAKPNGAPVGARRLLFQICKEALEVPGHPGAQVWTATVVAQIMIQRDVQIERF